MPNKQDVERFTQQQQQQHNKRSCTDRTVVMTESTLSALYSVGRKIPDRF